MHFLRVATLGLGILSPVICFITLEVFLPDTRITALPDVPDPDDSA